MKSIHPASWVFAALAVSLPVVPASAQYTLGIGVPGGAGGNYSARASYEQFQAQIEAAEARVRAIRTRVDNKMASQEELDAQIEVVRQLQTQLRPLAEQAARETVFEALRRPVTVTLRDATLEQMAAVLTKAGQLPIKVNAAVPQDKRVTISASDFSLARVLQATAAQMDVLLVPMGNPWVGVEITPLPRLTVGNQTQVAVSSLAPWSEAWGFSPTGDSFQAVAFSNLQPVAAPVGAPPAGVPATEPPPGREPTPAPAPENPTITAGPAPAAGIGGGAFGGGLSGSMMGMPMSGAFGMPLPANPAVSLTSPSPNMLVVAEPGGKDGAPGVFLTVYRIEGGQLKRTGSLFHRFNGTQQPGGMMPGIPGLPDIRGGMGGGLGVGALNPSGMGGFSAGGGGGIEVTPPPPAKVEKATPARPAPPKTRPGTPSRNRRSQSPPTTAPGAEVPVEAATPVPATPAGGAEGGGRRF